MCEGLVPRLIAELLGYAIGVGGNFCVHLHETSRSKVLATILRFVSLHGRVHNVLSIPTHQWRHTDTTTYFSVYINGVLRWVANLMWFHLMIRFCSYIVIETFSCSRSTKFLLQTIVLPYISAIRKFQHRDP